MPLLSKVPPPRHTNKGANEKTVYPRGAHVSFREQDCEEKELDLILAGPSLQDAVTVQGTELPTNAAALLCTVGLFASSASGDLDFSWPALGRLHEHLAMLWLFSLAPP